MLAALGDDGDLGQALGTAAGTAGARPAGGSSDILVPPPAFEERWGRRDQELSVLKCWWEICEACGKIRYLRGLELRRESAGALLIRAFTPRSTDPLLHTLTLLYFFVHARNVPLSIVPPR